jgi:hypothetical protein
MCIVSSFSFLNNPRDDINGPPKYDNQRPLNPGGDKGKTNSMLFYEIVVNSATLRGKDHGAIF